MKSAFLTCLTFLALAGTSFAADDARVDLSKIDRSIAKEPKYLHKPHYALVVFGPGAAHRSWLVMDGEEILYFDRNGNGDLTEPEDKIAWDEDASRKINMAPGSSHTGMNIFPLAEVAGAKLQFRLWVRNKDKKFVPTTDFQRKIFEERKANDWETGTLSRIVSERSGAQNGITLTTNPADAQITHLEGPLTFAFKWNDRQKLQRWPIETTFDVHIGTPGLRPRNGSYDVFSPLAETEVPRDLHPTALFEFPSNSPGGAPIMQSVALDLRCCGDTVYGRFVAPRGIGEGRAKVTLSYPDWKERVVHPITLELPIGGEPASHEPEVAFVMFRDPEKNFGLDEAMTELRVKGFKVQQVSNGEQDVLMIGSPGQSMLGIVLNRKPDVLETSKAFGERGPLKQALDGCDSRFEILAYPVERPQEDKRRLPAIYAALQEATQGILYTATDDRLAGPR